MKKLEWYSYRTCFLVTGTLGCDTAMADDMVIPPLVFHCLRFTKSLKEKNKTENSMSEYFFPGVIHVSSNCNRIH